MILKKLIKDQTKKDFPQNVYETITWVLLVLYFYLGKAKEQKFIEN